MAGFLNLDGDDTIYADSVNVTISTADQGSSVYAYGSNITIDAGAGSDLVSILGSEGSGLYIIGGDGNDSIENGSYVNYVHSGMTSVTIDAGTGNDSIMNHGSYASINAEDGNDHIENNAPYTTIDAGAGNDYIQNYTYGDHSSINAGDGNDYIENLYDDDHLTIDAGAGNDNIVSRGSYASIDAGSGNDDIINYGDHSSIDAGSGDDDIYNEGIHSSINAGDGNDSIDSRGSYTTIDAGDGDDAIVNYGSHASIDAGAGNDSIYNGVDHSSIDAGAGNDSIDSRGSYSSINAGSGDDTIYANGILHDENLTNFTLVYGKDDSISMGAGSDFLVFGGGTYLIQDFTSEDTISIEHLEIENSIQSESGSDVIISFGDSDSITLQNTYLNDLTVHDSLITYGSNSDPGSDTTSGSLNLDGDDTIYADNTNITIETNDFGSSIYAYGSNNTIDAGAGSDFVSINNSSLYIIGGSGNDSIYNDYVSNVSIDAGSGNDSIYNNRGAYASINAGDGSNTIENYGYYSSIITSDGDDSILTSIGRYIFVDAGSGNDTIESRSSQSTVLGGSGNDYINNIADSSMDNMADHVTIDAGAGNDTIDNFYGYYLSINGGDGDDSIRNQGNGLYSTVYGGSGNDTILNEANLILVFGDDGNDSIYNSGLNATIYGGAGDDTLYFGSEGVAVYSLGNDVFENFGYGDSISVSASDVISNSVQSGSDVVFAVGSSSITITNTNGQNIFIYDEKLITFGSIDYQPLDTTGSGSSGGFNTGSLGSDDVLDLVVSVGIPQNKTDSVLNFNWDNTPDDIITVQEISLYAGTIYSRDDSIVFNDSADSENRNLTFKANALIESWDVSLGIGDDQINIAAGGKYNGGNGADFFNVTDSLDSDVTITGGTGKTGNIFYAVADTVSNASNQNTITVTDANFDNSDVLLIDAGIENLTKDFFDEGKFFNYATATQASTSGVYAKNVFDASDIIEDLNMKFSMVKIANSSDVNLSNGNYVNSSTNLIWANDSATTIDLNQTGNILLFADTNDKADLISLSGNYNDTIHVGNNDTVYSGGGNDIIHGWSSSNMLILDRIGSAWLEDDDLIIDGSVTITGIDLSIDVSLNVDGVNMNILNSLNSTDSELMSLVATDS